MGIIIFFAAVLIAVGLGSKFKINYGIIAFALVLLIGTFYLGEGTSAIIGRFPVALFFNLFIVTAFYGFANENGALEGIAPRIIYRFRAKGWMMPFVVYGTTIVVAGMGAGAAATPIIMSAIAFSLAIKFGYGTVRMSGGAASEMYQYSNLSALDFAGRICSGRRNWPSSIGYPGISCLPSHIFQKQRFHEPLLLNLFYHGIAKSSNSNARTVQI